jgi:hypothetical protein
MPARKATGRPGRYCKEECRYAAKVARRSAERAARRPDPEAEQARYLAEFSRGFGAASPVALVVSGPDQQHLENAHQGGFGAGNLSAVATDGRRVLLVAQQLKVEAGTASSNTPDGVEVERLDLLTAPKQDGGDALRQHPLGSGRLDTEIGGPSKPTQPASGGREGLVGRERAASDLDVDDPFAGIDLGAIAAKAAHLDNLDRQEIKWTT